MKCKSIVATILGIAISFNLFSSELYLNRMVFADTSNKLELSNEMKQDLFYGYDVTSGISLMESDAIGKRFPIIDLDSNYYDHIKSVDGPSEQTAKVSKGNSIQDVTSEFSTNFNFDTLGKIYSVDIGLETQFDMTKKTNNVYAEYYEMCSMEIDRIHSVVDIDKDEIRNYLADSFVNELYAIDSKESAKEFFARYGTHLGTGYKYGGVMNITNYRTTSDYSYDFSEGLDLKTKVSYAKTGVDGSFSELYASGENTSTETSTYSFHSYGGAAVASLTIDDLFIIYDPALQVGEVEYGKWVQSINAGEKLTIIGIPNKCDMIPLWELLDPSNADSYVIRDILIETYIELCGDEYEKYLEMYPETNRMYKAPTIDEDSVIPSLQGAYVRTPNGYYYYVDSSDFSIDGKHYEIHEGDYLYLDLNNSPVDYEFTTNDKCELIDSKNAIFKITGNSDKAVINIKYGDTEHNIFSVKITDCSFEGGAGTVKYPYLIGNKEQFLKLNGNQKNSYYQLVGDINFGGNSISSIGTFKGYLDGNYCKVYNFKLTGDSELNGLFDENTGTIERVVFAECGTSTYKSSYDVIDSQLSADKITKPMNAVTSTSIGVLCGKNSGTIRDCYFVDTFIYNFNSDKSYMKDGKIEMSAGTICGCNMGTIEYCMVENSDVICAYVYKDESNEDYIYVYAGGIAGKVVSGTINHSVVKFCEDGYVYAKTGNYNDLFSNGNEIRTFAAGLVGYCDESPTSKFKNDYVYLAESNQVIVSNEKYGTFKPSNYHHLKSIFTIAGKDNVEFENCYGFCAVGGNELTLCVTPDAKESGDNSVSKSYTEITDGLKQDRVTDASIVNGDIKNLFIFEDNEICHILSLDKKDYIEINTDASKSEMKSLYCIGDNLTIKGLELNRNIDNKEAYDGLTVFRIKLYKNNMMLNQDTPFDEVGIDLYRVKVYMYSFDDGVYVPDDKLISVCDNEIIRFEVIVNDDSEVYLDNVDEYLSSWDASSLDIIEVRTNGEKINIIDDPDISISDFTVITSADDIVPGANVVEIRCNGLVSEYVLNVSERKVNYIKIDSNPIKTEYYAGENVELAGLKVSLVYENGDVRELDSLDDLEFFGTRVVEGNNTVWVAYDGYSSGNRASFTVVGNKTLIEVPEEISETSVEEKGNNSTIVFRVIVIVVAIILIVGVAMLYIVLSKKKNTKAPISKNDNSNDENVNN